MAAPILAALLLLQAAAPAQPPVQTASVQPAQAATPPAPAADPAPDAQPADPTVCRRIDVSGSPFSKKVCHSLSTWIRLDRQNQ
jgi:hypothetical protein